MTSAPLDLGREQARSLPHAEGFALARRLAEAIAPACERVEIAGSLRRERPVVSDLELVAIPRLREIPAPGVQPSLLEPHPVIAVNVLWEVLDGLRVACVGGAADRDGPAPTSLAGRAALAAAIRFGLECEAEIKGAREREPGDDDLGAAEDLAVVPLKPGVPGLESDGNWTAKRVAGSRYFKLYLPRWQAKVDLFLATPETWGPVFTIRTGSSEFSRALVSRWTDVSGGGHVKDGRIVSPNGTPLPAPDEDDVFFLCCARWVAPPARRTATDLVGLS